MGTAIVMLGLLALAGCGPVTIAGAAFGLTKDDDDDRDPMPPDPNLLAATNVVAFRVGPGRVDLTWVDNATSETQYRIERSPRGGQTFQAVGIIAPSSTGFADTTPSPGLEYDYRVFAVNALGDSLPSNVASTVPTTTGSGGGAAAPPPPPPTPPPTLLPPLAPSDLQASAVSAVRVDLTWTDNAATEDLFRVERRPAGVGSYVTVGTPTLNSTSFSDTVAEPGTAYDYRVLAFNAAGASAPSNMANVTTPEAP